MKGFLSKFTVYNCSHSIQPCISLRRKFNNQQNARHSAAVHYKHLRPALQLLVNFEIFFEVRFLWAPDRAGLTIGQTGQMPGASRLNTKHSFTIFSCF